MGLQPGLEPRVGLGLVMDDRKWNVRQGYWHQHDWAVFTGLVAVRIFDTWQQAFDYAFKEATRELSDR